MAKSTPQKVPPRKKQGTQPRPIAQPPRKPPANRRRSRQTWRSSPRTWIFIGVAIAAAVVLIVLLIAGSGGGGFYGANGAEGVPLEQGTPLAAANAHLTGKPINGISCLGQEQLTYHHHAHLVIFVNGQERPIPLGVGMMPPLEIQSGFAGSKTCYYYLHVHAQDGVIHIESPTSRTYTLGDFFAVWGQALSANAIGAYTGPVTVSVNGSVQPAGFNPATVPLEEHMQIVLNLGGPVKAPAPIDWTGTSL